jgi:NCS1 family nucleobase:cation symporter-1
LAGWIPTVGGLIVTVRGTVDTARALHQLYYMAFFFVMQFPHVSWILSDLETHTTLDFFTSVFLFYITIWIFPVGGMGAFDDVDNCDAFTAKEAAKLGVMHLDQSKTSLEGVEHIESLQKREKDPKTEYIVTDGVCYSFV